jgi:hypothetical protein
MPKISELRKTLNMPYLKVGTRVESTHHGLKGKVSGALNCKWSPNSISVTWDGDTNSLPASPQWMIKYFDKNNNVMAEFGR